jgi:hypothetical protein
MKMFLLSAFVKDWVAGFRLSFSDLVRGRLKTPRESGYRFSCPVILPGVAD